MKFEKKDLFTIPNILTYIRFACVPIFIWLMIEYKLDATKYSYLFSAFGLFICASITDIVDGAIARNYNMTSDIGKIIDPLADKLLQISALIMLTVVGNIHWIFTAIIFVKEFYLIVMTKYFMIAGKYQINQHSNVWGKVAAVVIFVAIIFGFAAGLHETIKWMSMAIFIIGLGFALFAAGQYTVKYAIELSGLKKSGILNELDKKGNFLNSNLISKETENEEVVNIYNTTFVVGEKENNASLKNLVDEETYLDWNKKKLADKTIVVESNIEKDEIQEIEAKEDVLNLKNGNDNENQNLNDTMPKSKKKVRDLKNITNKDKSK